MKKDLNLLLYGLGLMGGCVAKDLIRIREQTGRKVYISGIVKSEKSAAIIRDNALADEVYTEAEISRVDFSKYDIILIGVPVYATIKLMEALPTLAKDQLVMDMGSTKGLIMSSYIKNEWYKKFIFIGAHPMAGTEHSGPGAAIENLFDGKLCFLFKPEIPSDEGEDLLTDTLSALKKATEFWDELKAKTWVADVEEHDEVLAYLSHSPHLISSMLVLWASRKSSVYDLTTFSPVPITGGGFKDMVRIAGANPIMWEEIIGTNKQSILASMEDFRDKISEVITMLDKPETGELRKMFEEAFIAKKFLTEKK